VRGGAYFQNYEAYREKRFEGKDESEDREYEADMIIPALLDIHTPLDPFIIRPWVKTEDPVVGTYYYNVETGMQRIDLKICHFIVGDNDCPAIILLLRGVTVGRTRPGLSNQA